MMVKYTIVLQRPDELQNKDKILALMAVTEVEVLMMRFDRRVAIVSDSKLESVADNMGSTVATFCGNFVRWKGDK